MILGCQNRLKTKSKTETKFKNIGFFFFSHKQTLTEKKTLTFLIQFNLIVLKELNFVFENKKWMYKLKYRFIKYYKKKYKIT